MPTIKRKVEMILPQLIEWAWDNEIKDRIFLSNSYCVGFDRHGYIYFNSQLTIPPNQTFTVEVEEEITEDTVFPKIAELNLCGYDQHEELFMNENKSVKQLLSEEETNNKALYIVNDDYSMTLIWTKEKGLVE